MEKTIFSNSPLTIWGIAPYGVFIYSIFSMNNKFINNNGVNLLHTQNKKTKVEVQIEKLKKQEQEILKELSSWETKQCDNCQTNYSIIADNNQITEISQ